MDYSGLSAKPRGGGTFRIRVTYLVASLSLCGGFGGGCVDVKFLESPEPEPAAVPVFEVDTLGEPFLGLEDAPVTIVEFSDYQCPFCSRHNLHTLPQILSNRGSDIKYVVRNFPIASIHPDSVGAAVAAECAHEQGRFWAYHDLLFQNQDRLDADSLQEHALRVGLDTDEFGTCLVSADALESVTRDFQDGQSYGIIATPTFFINGRRLVGARSITVFQEIIDEALSIAESK